MVSTNYQGLFITKKGNIFVDGYDAEIVRDTNKDVLSTVNASPLMEKAKARKAKAIAATETTKEEA